MAALRCSTCGVNYPASHATGCSVCGDELDLLSHVDPDPDWQEKVQLLRGRPEPQTEEERMILGWRREQLERAGYCKEQADALAGRLDVDLHRAVRLLRTECPVKTALQILL